MTWRGVLRRTLDVSILALVGWLLLTALYVSLGRQFVPAIADYQSELVARIEQATGRAIQLQKLSGEMQGAQPVFVLQGLVVHQTADPQSPVLLALDHVVARLDVFASLWQRQPVMDALQIEGLALEMTQASDGHWALTGLGRSQTAPVSLDEVARRLFSQRRITLLDTQIRIRPHGLPEWSFSRGELTMLNGRDWHRLDGRLYLPSGERIRWQLNGASREAKPDLEALSLGFFVELPQGDWSQWVPAAWLEQGRINSFDGGGRFWGTWGDGSLRRLQAELFVPQLSVATVDGAALIEELAGRIDLRLTESSQHLAIEGFGFRLGEHTWPTTRAQASRSAETGDWEVALDAIDLATAADLAKLFLPEQRASMLRSLNPGGVIGPLHLQGGANWRDLQRIQLEARVARMSIEPWQAVPGFSGISGHVSGTPAAGELRLASNDWSLYLPRLFEQPWRYDSLGGALGWRWDPQRGLSLDAPGLSAQGDSGRAGVRLRLSLPPERDQASMDLDVALHDTRAERVANFLPVRSPALNPRLKEWLAGTELDGEIPLAVFGYHGSLRAGAPPGEREVSLYAELRNGRMVPMPGWPALEAIDATLRVRDQDVVVDQARAQLWDSELSDIRAVVGRDSPDQPLRLGLAAAFDGPVADALRFLRDSPVAQRTGAMLSGWAGAGEISGSLRAGVELTKGATPAVDLDFALADARLSIPSLQTALSDITGQFDYVHGRGIAADDVTLRLLGEPVGMAISSEAMEHRLRVKGRHPLDTLRQWPLLSSLPVAVGEGRLSWRGDVLLGAERQVIDIRSDLVGVTLDAPPPFGKPAEAELPSRVTLTRTAAGQSWAIEAGAETAAIFEQRDGKLAGQINHRTGEPERIAGNGIGIDARLAELDLSVWQTWLEQLQVPAVPQPAVVSRTDPAGAAQIRRLDLQVGRFVGLGLELDKLHLLGERSKEGDWRLQIDQEDVEGHVLLPASTGQPLVIALDRLRLPRSEKAPDDGSVLVEPLTPRDVLAHVRPSQLRPFDLGIGELFWGNDLVGSLAFVLRPEADGAQLKELTLKLRGGLHLSGNLYWGETVTRSRFTGTLAAADIGEVLRTWQYAPTLTSKAFSAEVDLDWPGSPAYFAMKRSTGLLALQASDGMLKSGEGSADALRVFGLLNFNALTRRLRLDFSDLFGRGTAYDTLTADLSLTNGLMQTRKPLLMEGPSAKVQLDGQIDLPRDHIDMGMLVTLPVTNNLPLAAIIAGAPHIGGVLFLADKILGDRVARFASVKYRISGDWQQPTVDFDRAFDDEAALEETP